MIVLYLEQFVIANSSRRSVGHCPDSLVSNVSFQLSQDHLINVFHQQAGHTSILANLPDLVINCSTTTYSIELKFGLELD
jgi:hypothetical protein